MNRLELTKKKIEYFSYIVYIFVFWHFCNVLGAQGTDYFMSALISILMIFELCFGSSADSLGKLLRFRMSRGQYRNVEQMRTNVFFFSVLVALGVCGAVFGFSNRIISLIGQKYALIAFQCMIPFLFFRSVTGVLTGFCMGTGNQLVEAIVRFFRPFLIVLFGNLFSNQLFAYGEKVSALLFQNHFSVMYRSIGYGIGISVAEAVTTVLLFIYYIFFGRRLNKTGEGMRKKEKAVDHIRLFISKSLAPNLKRFFCFLPIFGVGMLLHGSDAEDSSVLFGRFLNGYMFFVMVICFLLALVMMEIGTKTYQCIRREERQYARIGFLCAVHLILVYGVFLAVLFTVQKDMVGQILAFEGEDNTSLFSAGAFLFPVSMILAYSATFLEKMKKNIFICFVIILSNVFFFYYNHWLVQKGIPVLEGVIQAGVLAGAICGVVMMAYCMKLVRAGIEVFVPLILPIISCSVVGLLFLFLEKILLPTGKPAVVLTISFLIGLFVHLGVLFLCRNISEEELDFTPGGKFLKQICIRIGIY